MSPGTLASARPPVVHIARLAGALVLAGGLLACAGRRATRTTPAVAATFEVRLHRPAIAGRRGRLTVDFEKHMTTQISRSGQTVLADRDDLVVHVDAIEETVSVATSGEWRVVRFTVEEFDALDVLGHHELARHGQVVTVARGVDGRAPRVTVDDRPADESVRAALDVAVLGSGSGPTDDEVFGTAQRQAVGASWPVHGELALRELERRVGAPLTVTGRTRLDARTAVGGTDCLSLWTVMDGVFNERGEPAPDRAVLTGRAVVSYRDLLPLESAARRRARAATMYLELFTNPGPGAPSDQSAIHLTFRQSRSETFAPLSG